jgi:hypothetical protein
MLTIGLTPILTLAPLRRFDRAACFDRNRHREERSDAAIQQIIGLLRRPLDRHAPLAMTTEVTL